MSDTAAHSHSDLLYLVIMKQYPKIGISEKETQSFGTYLKLSLLPKLSVEIPTE